ncbi:MAG: hypothetical protein CL441_09055 [Acidimicrobiaceae bacterium]|nr:hypothetical protein [Acidimicrobiaceae bacterium]
MTEADVKTALLPGLTVRQYALLPEGQDAGLIGHHIAQLDFPDGVAVASVTRLGAVLPADPELVLEADDQLTVYGPEEVMPPAGDAAPVATLDH